MNSVNSKTRESKESLPDNIFPEAVEIERNWDSEFKKRINNSKSELANYILKELNEFKNTGKNIEIELNRVNYTKIEKDIIKKMLFEKGWIVQTEVRSYNIPNWEYENSFSNEKTIYWIITKSEKLEKELSNN
jgi:hypothetical protein